MLARPTFTRKRELIDGNQRPNKRNRPDKEYLIKTYEKKFKKRKVLVVVDELCLRAENDRQLTNNLLRELDNEHVRNVNKKYIVECCTKLLTACSVAKLDTISCKIFRTLFSIMKQGDRIQWISFLESLKNFEVLFTKICLDANILEVYTFALSQEYIKVEDIPEQVMVCSKRGISQTHSTDNRTKSLSINFQVSYFMADTKSETKMKECEKLLCKLAVDRDFRTRNVACEGFLKLTEHGYKLNKSTYQIIKGLMTDTDSNIRIMALSLSLYFANRKPSETTSGKGTILITDDAFSAVCDAMNDIELNVRVKAAKILGGFENVSEELIHQTLDKKMMRTNKASEVVKIQKIDVCDEWKFLKKNKNTEQQDNSRGGWSRGKELNASCPEASSSSKNQDEDDDSIIPHGACGAFVSALEDEFMDVRRAAVWSLGKLASNRPSFAISALEYLADMFNDEISDVRLDAINALTPLISHGQLNSEQLNVILKCLDDGMADSRQAMRELLKRAQFVDVQCIELCVKALLACLKRFPKDKDQIFSCMGFIGKNHSIQVQSMMRDLLGINLLFHTREHSIEDVVYLAKLVMVLNAASQQNPMVHLMPEFVQRHYRFLRSSSPHLVSAITILDEQSNGKLRLAEKSENTAKAEEIVLKTYSRLCESENCQNIMDRNIKRDGIFRDASAVSIYNENVSGAARLICCLGEIATNLDNVANTVIYGGEIGDVRSLIAQHLENMQSIEYQFSGITPQIQSYLTHCRFYLSFIDLLTWMFQTIVQQNEIISIINGFCEDSKRRTKNIQISEEFQEIIEHAENIFVKKSIGEESKKIITSATICAFLDKAMPKLPNKFPKCRNLHLKYAQITTPNKDTAIESAVRFFSNMPHGIAFEANLLNLCEGDSENIRIRTVFPDGKADMMKPREKDIKLQEDGSHVVSTHVKVTSSNSWADSAEIDIIIGLLLPNNSHFVPLFASPSCFTQAHVRVKIHPVSR
ncbi:unnamed protein product [Caenorhabditis angaria]|uniref:Integrator complex subunit 4/Protein SIEL C-terminal Ig-like domain-containing protein n=1 Tax=Caenorhabditis angaria TaxID=860376 RepID=A0A9P1I4N3_9PELO|nr:unnamed protein product [Caenorhabditis angaria]